MIYNDDNRVDIPNVDLLTLLFGMLELGIYETRCFVPYGIIH